MPRPITVHIHHDAIAHNLDIIKQNAKDSKTFAVLKANAYGHGIENIYQGLENADGIAVLDLAEAILLRELGWQKKILLLEGFFEIADLEIVTKYQLDVAIHSIWQLELFKLYLKNNASQIMHRYHIFLKMNSGMNRLGLTPSDYQKVFLELIELKKAGYIDHITHMTHFANADLQTTPPHLKGRDVDAALTVFNAAISSLYDACNMGDIAFLQDIFHTSAANSGAILWHPDTHTSPLKSMLPATDNWVRGGIMLYGASPSGLYQDIAGANLAPTMSLKAQIISIQNLKAGEAVGYGSQFIAEQDMQIATIACGYADGYPRIAKNAPVYLNGQKTQTLGRVSMDMIAIDLRGCQNHSRVEIGDEVLLWGQSIQKGQKVYLPIDEVANAAQTIGYELMCGITKRVRVEKNNLF